MGRARIHHPDLVLMDVRMPRCDGLEATRAIAAANPEIRIVMLTTSDAAEHLYEAIASGAYGYLVKSISGEELVAALDQVAQEIPPFSPGLAACLLAEVSEQEPKPARRTGRMGRRVRTAAHPLPIASSKSCNPSRPATRTTRRRRCSR